MLRLIRCGIGPFITSENGDPNKPADFNAMLAYSPILNVESAEKSSYPPLLLKAGWRDVRVDPWQAFKLFATLQRKGHSNAYLQVEAEAGHSSWDRPLEMKVRQAADEYAFLVRTLGPLKFQKNVDHPG
jgi:prolyl oligopeptidase PreP (S9A serine peptidase family)